MKDVSAIMMEATVVTVVAMVMMGVRFALLSVTTKAETDHTKSTAI